MDENIKDNNIYKLEQVVKIIRLTADNLINKEVDGILKKPTSIGELNSFNKNIETLIVNRLRKNFGV